MSNIFAKGTGLLLFASLGIGLLDLLQGLSVLPAIIALAFILAGIFNTWSALN